MRFLILQARPEAVAADGEYRAIVQKSGLTPAKAPRLRLDDPACATLDLGSYDGVIVGGGPGCVSDEAPDPLHAAMEASLRQMLRQILADDIPFMGCCYGHGVLASHLGAEVSKARYAEPIGTSACWRTTEDPLLSTLPKRFDAFVGHKEAVQALPDGAAHLIASSACPIQMFRVGQNVYGTQFHPELDGPGLAERIRAYRGFGYFAPEEETRLIELALAAQVTVPPQILANFVTRYRGQRA